MITNEVINKDIKKTNNKIWISLLVIILGIGLFFFGEYFDKKLKKDAQNLNDVIESKREDKENIYTYLDVKNTALLFAGFDDKKEYYYFVTDGTYVYIAYMDEATYKENFENNENYYSLAHFLERLSNGVVNFGSMVSGKLVLWIEGVKPNEIWHNTKKTSDGKFGNAVLESEEKRAEFFKELLEYLKKLIQQYTFDDLIKYLNDEENLTQHFGSPSFIEKIVIFNAWTETLTDEERENNKTYDYNNKLVFIYKINKIAEIKLIDEEHGKKHMCGDGY